MDWLVVQYRIVREKAAKSKAMENDAISPRTVNAVIGMSGYAGLTPGQHEGLPYGYLVRPGGYVY